MKKETFHLLTRFFAGVAAALILVGAASMLPRKAPVSNIYQTASGIRADATVLSVDGEAVTAEEYLYYLMECGYQYYSYYAMSGEEIDWNMAVPTEDSGDITLAEYIHRQAYGSAVQNAAIRKMAADNGITVTQEESDAFAESIAQLKEQLGDGCSQALASYGLTESLWQKLYETSCLVNHLQEAYVSGALRPDDAALLAMVEEHGLVMARSVLVSTAYLDEQGVAEAKATAEEYRARILAREDIAEAMAEINTELGVSDEENIASLYHCGHDHGDGEEDAVCAALEALAEGELSEVIEADDGFYLLLRDELDMDAVAEVQFGEDLEEQIAGAEVIENESVLDCMDMGAFMSNIIAAIGA